MNLIRSFYKTKNLASNGVFIAIVVIILLVVGYFIPDTKPKIYDKQIYTLNGYLTKYDNYSEVSDFFLSIKNNRGFLVLGTSETGSLRGGNYYDFLNHDKDIEGKRFSYLAGAGRTCGTYIPLLLNHRDQLDSLQLIYYINPAYWRENLSEVNVQYWNRYTNFKLCHDLNLTAQERKDFWGPVESYSDKLHFFHKSVSYIEHTIRSARKKYFNNLRYLISPAKYNEQFQFMTAGKRDYSLDSIYGNIDYELIDTNFNILKSFTEEEWFKPMNKSVNYKYKWVGSIDESQNYRYMELASFVKLCKHLGIKATFIIAPYNEIFIRKYYPRHLNAHARTTQKIKQLLINHDADFIDATDISPVVGAFNDYQHHSSYGAYLLYLKIKEKLYEE